MPVNQPYSIDLAVYSSQSNAIVQFSLHVLIIAMASRRAIWVDDETVAQCAKCRKEFTFFNAKHHCRRCGLIFCHECSTSKMIIPHEELVARPSTWLTKNLPPDMMNDEDNFRCPHRVCDPCSFILKDKQPELRQLVSRYFFHPQSLLLIVVEQ
ncbi:hypothetical protein EON65_20235 [archaeon]|nr:MAG: hypothetical protein EON65_20235 [archaeon]